MISLQNISKSYNGRDVLHNFSLEMPQGETVALIGPSGCGKSTLLRITMGLIKQNSGSVFISGEELKEDNVLQLRRKMGYVIQKGGLFPHLTARKNCALAAQFLGWSPERIKERTEELAGLVKIKTEELDRLPGNLSGGQQQRISLVRALMLDPEIIILDEPLGSIDPLVRYELQTDLKAVFTELKKTVLLVTHDLGEAAFLARHIVLMREGRLVQQGGIKEFVHSPADDFVKRFVNAQRSPISEAGQ